jgi:hypothetical protein
LCRLVGVAAAPGTTTAATTECSLPCGVVKIRRDFRAVGQAVHGFRAPAGERKRTHAFDKLIPFVRGRIAVADANDFARPGNGKSDFVALNLF